MIVCLVKVGRLIFFPQIYSLFHILLVRTNYEEFSNLKRIEKKIEKISINPIIDFDLENMKLTL